MILDWGTSTAHAQLPSYLPAGGFMAQYGTAFVAAPVVVVTPGIIRITNESLGTFRIADDSIRSFAMSGESLKGSL